MWDSPNLHRVQGVAGRAIHGHLSHDEHHDFSALVVWKVSSKEAWRDESRGCTLAFVLTKGGCRRATVASIPIVWMMAFWTMRSSLSFPRPDETLQAEFLRELSPNSKSTLIRRCLSRVLNTSSTVGPAVTQQSITPDQDQRRLLHERLQTQLQSCGKAADPDWKLGNRARLNRAWRERNTCWCAALYSHSLTVILTLSVTRHHTSDYCTVTDCLRLWNLQLCQKQWENVWTTMCTVNFKAFCGLK